MGEERAARTRNAILDTGPALAFAGMMGVTEPDFEGAGLPLLWHWFYLLDRPPQSDLGPDGHAVRGVVPTPPQAGQRRMFAGGRARQVAPLHLGVMTTRRTEVVSSTSKQGRSGALTFVTVRHTLTQEGMDRVIDEQDIVYRDAGAASASDPVVDVLPDISVAKDEWSIPVDPVLLFRFSALTYNSHRIHYDRAYARDVEGYPGLVTHGPLQALAMIESVRRMGVQPTSIDYRLVAPLFDHQGMIVQPAGNHGSAEARVRDRSGRVTATAAIT